jgi:cytochrome c biogenesis protein CcdA
MKKIFQVLKNRWAEYVIEILVIIIGITLSFFFNNLKENRVERKEEIKLLASIHENLATDTLTLDARLKILDILLHGLWQSQENKYRIMI